MLLMQWMSVDQFAIVIVYIYRSLSLSIDHIELLAPQK
jgi:hypothetical protein